MEDSMSLAVKISRFWVVGLASLLVLFPLSTGFAQEHPEHPTKSTPKPKVEVTKEMMAQAITDYVSRDAKMKGGYFLVYDTKAKKTLTLTLDKVHQDRLSQVDERLFFACSDFKSSDGKSYDLDFFMKGKEAASGMELTVSEIMIHKQDGKPRYNWYEEEGIWKRKEASQ